MKTFTNESKEEGARLALGRRSKSNATQPRVYHAVEGASASTQTPVFDGLSSNGRPISRRSMIQLQQNCGNRCAQQAVKLAPKSEDEMMQTKSLGADVHRQTGEEPEEEEALQTKQATSEIQRQVEEEEEKKPV